jgi:hypothetical protein
MTKRRFARPLTAATLALATCLAPAAVRAADEVGVKKPGGQISNFCNGTCDAGDQLEIPGGGTCDAGLCVATVCDPLAP